LLIDQSLLICSSIAQCLLSIGYLSHDLHSPPRKGSGNVDLKVLRFARSSGDGLRGKLVASSISARRYEGNSVSKPLACQPY